MMLARSGARALAGKASGTPLAAFYGTEDDRSMGEKARDAAGELHIMFMSTDSVEQFVA